MVPLEDPEINRRVRKILDVYFRDNTQAYGMDKTGEWERLTPGADAPPLRAQERFYERCRRRFNEAEERAKREMQVRRPPPN